jgi:hypothetical protein
MAEAYSPIMRTFCRFRAGVLRYIDIDRHAIRPGTPLEFLLPVPIRRAVWEHLRRHGLRPPALEFSKRDLEGVAWAVLRGAVSAGISLQRWSALFAAIPLIVAIYGAHRRQAVELPRGIKNVGELVLYMTRFADHKESGYRWTRNEIELKVRLIIAESMGLDVDDVRPECTWSDPEMLGNARGSA